MVFSLLVMICLLPAVSGYGTSFETAELKTPGVHYEALPTPTLEFYFKVHCINGTILSVIATFAPHIGTFGLKLYNTTQDEVDVSNNPSNWSNESCSIICNATGFYFIKFWWPGEPLHMDIVMTITGASDPNPNDGIPGFGFLFLLI